MTVGSQMLELDGVGGLFCPPPYKLGSQNTPYKLGLNLPCKVTSPMILKVRLVETHLDTLTTPVSDRP